MPFWVVALLAAAPLLGDEFPLDPIPHAGPAWSTQDLPRAATLLAAGGASLIVWRDFRAGNADIYAARIDASGAVLDPNGIALTATVFDEGPPAVAVAGGNFVVTWAAEGRRIEAKRISPSGVILEAIPTVVFASVDPNSAPDVACDASSCRFVWVSAPLGQPPTIFTRTINLLMGGLTPASQVVPGSTHTQTEPRITSGATFVVAWTDTLGAVRSILAARYDSAGIAMDPNGFPVTTGALMESKAHVASSPTKTIISWLNDDGTVDALWLLNGGALSPGPGVPPLFPGPATDLDVTFSGASFFVTAARTDGSMIEVRTVLDTLSAASVISQVATSSNALEHPALAPTAPGALLAFRWQVLGPSHVFSQQLDSAAGPIGPTVCVSRAASPQDEPRVTFDGLRFVAAWNEARDFASYFPETYATRIELDAGVSSPVQVSLEHRNVCELAGHGGLTQLVFWEETLMRLEGNRLGAAAAPLDGLGVGLLPAGYNTSPGLAWGNGRALVAYGTGSAVGLAFITPDGDAGVGFSLPVTNGSDSPRVASSGGDFLVVWLGRDASFNVNVFGMRVSASGAFLDAQPFIIAAPPGAVRPFELRVASNGSEYLAVWQDDRLGSADIYAARIFLDGGTPDSPSGFDVMDGPGDQVRPDLVWDGSRWIVAWTHRPDGGMPNVEARLLSTSPQAKEEVFSISSHAVLEAVPHLASNGAGRSLVVYQAFDPLLLNSRVRARALTRLAKGLPCSREAECGSGFCVDGVCCNVLCNGSNPNDCQACASSAGASQDGVCAPINTGAICRPAASMCDVAETCSGAFDCPADVQPICDGGSDGGQADAGTPDGGTAVDAGTADGGNPGPGSFTVGCGCGPSNASVLGMLVLLLAGLIKDRNKGPLIHRSPRAESRGPRVHSSQRSF